MTTTSNSLALFEHGRAELGRVLAGQQELVEQSLLTLLCGGHALIEGVPGVAKTLAVKTLSRFLGLEFRRVQGTPDIMPADILGTNVFSPKTGEFHLHKGPVFTQFLLADEINRMPPRTQAALLESMEERQVTLDGETYALPQYFTVFATQNPLEFEGTYPLPEAQLDRFLMKIRVGYPDATDERMVLERHHAVPVGQRLEDTELTVVDGQLLEAARAEVRAVQVEPALFDYLLAVVRRTREWPALMLGASPRAATSLLLVAKGYAARDGRDYLLPDDVKAAAVPVLRHRLILKPEAELEGFSTDRVIADVLAATPLPPLRAAMQTLIPVSVTAEAHPKGKRLGRLLGFGATPRLLLLLAASILLSIPAFLASRTPWLMFALDAVLLLAFVADAWLLPAPETMQVTRRFLHAPELGSACAIELQVVKSANGLHTLRFTDDLHASMLMPDAMPMMQSYANEPATVQYEVMPSQRGDLALGKLYVRYRSAIGFAERWAVADLRQTVRVYAAGEQANASSEMFLLRARQIEMEKRRLRRIGLGREFEALRDYRAGDELRNISWKATARQNKLITQTFTTERSQQVWIVLDAGRLSRTAFELKTASFADGNDAMQIVTQLDQAASAAGQLARVIQQSGDRSALLAYGRGVQQQLLPSSGVLHVRRMVDALSQVRSEHAEADHLMASVRLRQLQRKRGLVLWITEMTESAGRPEIVTAVTALVKRHLVVLVLLQHPELEAMAASAPKNAREMYAVSAAQEMLERRKATLMQLRSQGVLVVETSAGGVASDSITKYLEVKAQGKL